MSAALIATVALMGLAGAPHCAAMCGAPCAALTSARPAAMWGWQGARALSYALAGAAVATSVGALAWLAPAAPALRSLAVLVHAAALALGLWLLVCGRWPAWAASGWRPPLPAGVAAIQGPCERRTARAVAAGGLWTLMPCGLLQSALLVAALADSPAQAALAMAAFALASAVGPWLAPQLLSRCGALQGSALGAATRAAGALLAGASTWALGHGLWQRVQAWCG